MRILPGSKSCKQFAANVNKIRGGMVFHKALQRSLAVNQMVKERFMRNQQDVTPVVCYNVDSRGRASTAAIACNPQETMNKVAQKQKWRESGRPNCSGHLQVPEKFFCIPCFESQEFTSIMLSPQRFEDDAEFRFVDLNKFRARNSSSVLNIVIFLLALVNIC